MSYYEFKLPPGKQYQEKKRKLRQELDRWCSLRSMTRDCYEWFELDARRIAVRFPDTHDRNYFLQEWKTIDPWLQFLVRPGSLNKWASMSWRYREVSELFEPLY